MNVLFLTLASVKTVEERGLYQDLMREFAANGHRVCVVSPNEKRNRKKTVVVKDKFAEILRVRTGNFQQTNLIEKGISTLRLEAQYKKAIKKYFKGIKFDLVLYSTPPITFEKVVAFIKKRDNAKSFLLLKDIFPQNAVDIGILKKSGLKGVLYRYFRKKEKNLYRQSDFIGCMSNANCRYVLEHNAFLSEDKVVVCPNCIEPQFVSLDGAEREAMREKYGLPQDKVIFVYGGNLGRPQGIPFIIDCLRSQKSNGEAFFFIVGGGTDYGLLEEFIENEKQENVKLMKSLPKEDFDKMLAACDIGLIFLDHRFTIPNYPSRMLSYMQAGLPVLACTDPNTDVGNDIVENGFGWRCESDSADKFSQCVAEAVKEYKEKAVNSTKLLETDFSVKNAYKIIVNCIE